MLERARNEAMLKLLLNNNFPVDEKTLFSVVSASSIYSSLWGYSEGFEPYHHVNFLIKAGANPHAQVEIQPKGNNDQVIVWTTAEYVHRNSSKFSDILSLFPL